MRLRLAVLFLLLFVESAALAENLRLQGCGPGESSCLAADAAIIIWRDGKGHLQGLARHPDAVRVFLRYGNQRSALGEGRNFDLTEFQLQVLASRGARIEVEHSNSKVLSHSAHSILRAIRELPAPKPPPVPGPLSKFADEADRLVSAPDYLVPSTKPQAEFSIRSQGGQSIFSETGR